MRLLLSAANSKYRTHQNLSDTESTHLALIEWTRCSQCCCEPSGCCWARECWPSRGQFPNFSSWSPGRQAGRPCGAAVLPGREGRNRFHRLPPARGIQTGMSVSPKTEPAFVLVNLLRSPWIDSQPRGPVRQPYSSYRPARLHRLVESIRGLHKLLQIRTLFFKQNSYSRQEDQNKERPALLFLF